MGVPGLFANLCKKYKNRIIYNKKAKMDEEKINKSQIESKKIADAPDALFFDFNCLIHPVCRLVWNEYKDKKSIEEFEQLVIKHAIEYMERIIEYAKPKEICGIYIDGVCPLAKMNQQRQRRFASVIDKETMNNIIIEHCNL